MPILELLRILFSKEARNSASGVMKFIRRQPEWKQDVVTLSGKFTDGRKEQALAFTGHAESLLTAKNWESDAARQVRFASIGADHQWLRTRTRREEKGERSCPA